MMKKSFFFAALLCLFFGATAQNYTVLQSDYSQVKIAFDCPEPMVSETDIMKTPFSDIYLEGFEKQSTVGLPALPALVKMIEVPLGEGLSFNIESIVADTIDGNILGISMPIIPAQPSRSKGETNPPVLVMDREAYSTDAFYGNDVVTLQGIGISRDRNLALVTFSPIKWNPVTNRIVVVKKVTVTITQRNADVEATKRMHSIYSNPAFNSGVQTINSLEPKDSFTSAPLRYTIVAHSSFRGQLDEFATWKRRKGFIVDLVYTDESNVGTTTTSIKNFLKGLYDNATATSPAPTYVLFVGDVAQIPAFNLTANSASHHSDLSYCCFTSGDNLPDCYYGRFSAQNVSQLTPQISKTLMYEQYTFPDPTYLNTAALIAGVDGGYSSDNAYKYADPSMDYVAKTYITAANGFSNIVYYKNNTSFAPTGVTVTGSSQASSTPSALISLYNSGCGFVNYTAHGSETSWGQPSFTASNVSQMSNNNKPMVMIGNCCLTNSFQVDACLGESVLRKGNNAGAVAYIGGSDNTYWTEDFYWTVGVRTSINNTCDPSYNASNLGMYDRLYHSHGETYSNWYTTLGSMITAGNMAVQSSTSSDGMKLYYWQIYHLMGDPSVMPYYHGEAEVMNVNIQSAIPVGMTSVTITAVPYAYVGFTDDNHNLIAAAFANASGQATLNIGSNITPGVYEVVVTAQGYQPYIQNVNVISNGAYVIPTSMTATGNMTAGSNIAFDVVLKNVGVSSADNVSIEFQSVEGFILLNNTGAANLNTSLSPNQEYSINATCSGTIWGNVADQSEATINVIIRWGSDDDDVSTSQYRFTIKAPLMECQSYSIGSGFNAQGEATLTVVNKNNGHATLGFSNVSLLCLDPAISIVNPTNTIFGVGAGQELTHTYTLTAPYGVPENRSIVIIQTITTVHTVFVDTIQLVFGQVGGLMTFEDNSWGSVTVTQGTYPWTIVNQNAYAGTYCARSYAWTTSSAGSNKTSEMSITWTSTADDSITFYRNVSSENNYDFFRFYIDNQQKEEVSGTSNSWTRKAYFVPQGTHTFKFSYEKDYSVNSGSDCAWIDNLHLPIAGTVVHYTLDSICEGVDYQWRGMNISASEIGEGYFQIGDTVGDDYYYLTLVVHPAPEVTISGGDVSIEVGQTVRLEASGAENYLWNTGENNAIIDVHPTSTTTYTVTGYNGGCSAQASTTITVINGSGIGHVDAAAMLLYPNPVTESIVVECQQMKHIAVCDATGRTVIAFNTDTDIVTLYISSLDRGIYFVQTKDADGNVATAKFVKK